MQFEIVSGRDPSTTITITITMAAGKAGPKRGNPAMRDEHTLMRTVKKIHNFRLREKVGSEIVIPKKNN